MNNEYLLFSSQMNHLMNQIQTLNHQSVLLHSLGWISGLVIVLFVLVWTLVYLHHHYTKQPMKTHLSTIVCVWVVVSVIVSIWMMIIVFYSNYYHYSSNILEEQFNNLKTLNYNRIYQDFNLGIKNNDDNIINSYSYVLMTKKQMSYFSIHLVNQSYFLIIDEELFNQIDLLISKSPMIFNANLSFSVSWIVIIWVSIIIYYFYQKKKE